MLVSLAWLVAGLVALFAGGELLVRGAAALGSRFGLSPLVSGLTIVAFGTSAPELAVSLQAALDGIAGLAVGNVVGSNICNIALILGLTALVRPPTVEAVVIRRDIPIMIAGSMLLIAMLLDDSIGRIEGGALAAALLAYIVFTIRMARRASQAVSREFAAELSAVTSSPVPSTFLLMAGLLILVFGSDMFVRGASQLAAALGVPAAVIGLSIVAIGTSLPEIATSLVAAIRGHGDMAVGNLVGSNIFNIFGILGATALVRPVSRGAVGASDLGAMMLVALVLVPLAFTARRVDRWEGGVLLAIYAAYLAWLIA